MNKQIMQHIKRAMTTSALLLVVCTAAHSQEVDLFKKAQEEAKGTDSSKTVLVEATFKSTRLISGHTVETTKAGMLDFWIAHRFGFLNQGAYEFFGLDNATERLGLDYGITNKLTVGIGRSTFQKQMDGFIKYKLLQQSTGRKNMPITLSLMSSIVIRTLRETDPAQKRSASDKTSYVYQLLLARKFSEKTSFQLMPTMVHFNMVPLATDANDRFSLGIGGRQKISKRISINAEYYWQFSKFEGYSNALAVGVDIETGGHVFQLHFTNATGMTEPTFIHGTTGKWKDGDIHFGFNISRVFNVRKKKQYS